MLEVKAARAVQGDQNGFPALDDGVVLEGHVELVQGETSRGCLQFPSSDIHICCAVIVEFNPFSIWPHLAVRANGIGKDF